MVDTWGVGEVVKYGKLMDFSAGMHAPAALESHVEEGLYYNDIVIKF